MTSSVVKVCDVRGCVDGPQVAVQSGVCLLTLPRHAFSDSQNATSHILDSQSDLNVNTFVPQCQIPIGICIQQGMGRIVRWLCASSSSACWFPSLPSQTGNTICLNHFDEQ